MYPTDIKNSPWVYYGSAQNKIFGKWMLFIPKHDLNVVWNRCIHLYTNNCLTGVETMKCSTGYINPRANNHDQGVIIMYTKFDVDEVLLKIGENIVQKTGYNPKNKTMYYKTDAQTYRGTSSTGNRINHSLKITIS